MKIDEIPRYLAIVFFVGGIYFLTCDVLALVLWLLFIPTAWFFEKR